MKRFLTFALACFPLMCIGAPSISYTTYFNNTHTYTNSTTAGTNSASRGVFTNGITAGASTFSGAVGFANGTGALPSISFTSDPDLGFYRFAENQIGIGSAGGIVTRISNAGFTLKNDILFGWSTDPGTVAADVVLLRDGAANTLALRNAANAQTFNIYNTYTDASNYERFSMRWNSGVFELGTQNAGTGSERAMEIGDRANAASLKLWGSGHIDFNSNTTTKWSINSSGHFVAGADNTYDIGASGATRPRTIYAAAGVNAGSGSTSVFQNGKIIALQFTGGSYGGSQTVGLFSPSDGVLQMYDAAGTSFNRLQFGGTTASYPALKRSTTNLVVRLADDSANTGLEANVLISRLNATSAAAPTIASATTIAPTNSIVFISGTDAIETITAPAPISATGGQITLIPTGIFTTTTAGNIALASTAVVSKALIMTYDSGSTKWYPSY